MALRALIVDDEADARDNLRLMLEEHCPEVQIVGQAGSAPEAREKIQAVQPNALFLDIKMPGKMASRCSLPSLSSICRWSS
ncbi:MAG: response regulator [Flavobacteriales bacterium]|nr:response regulator [Flavobacteriales bacterium]